jgi:phosphocarrier protein NPr
MSESAQGEFLIVNKCGLHARAATVLAQLAVNFDATVTLYQDDKQANADSVLALLLLESSQGKYVKVVCEGPDADAALKAVGELIEHRFNEDE